MNIVLIGPQGAGKGTVAERLSRKYDIPHISTGDMFRDAAASGSELGKKVKVLIDKGILIDDDTTTGILKNRLNEDDASDGFILDGYPRNLEQAKRLESLSKIDSVLLITVRDDLILERLHNRISCRKCHEIYNFASNPPKKENICDKCGSEMHRRDDESEDAIKKRLEIYHEQTEPLINYYTQKGILSKIDNSLPYDEIESVMELCYKALEASE